MVKMMMMAMVTRPNHDNSSMIVMIILIMIECKYDSFLFCIQMLGTTVLYMASKAEESPHKLRDVINVCHRSLHQNTFLDVGSEYWELRDSLFNCELFLLRVLGFRVSTENPHKVTSIVELSVIIINILSHYNYYHHLTLAPSLSSAPSLSPISLYSYSFQYLLHYLKSLQDWVEPDVWKISNISQITWSILCDSIHIPLILDHQPSHIAIAVIFFGILCTGMQIPSQGARKTWWEVRQLNLLILN